MIPKAWLTYSKVTIVEKALIQEVNSLQEELMQVKNDLNYLHQKLSNLTEYHADTRELEEGGRLEGGA